LNPQEIWGQLARANNARAKGDFILAEQRYLETLTNFPNRGEVYYELAWNYKLKGEGEKAQRTIEEALVLMEKPNIAFLIRSGQIYEWRGNTEKALNFYQSILLIEPENVVALDAIQKLISKNSEE